MNQKGKNWANRKPKEERPIIQEVLDVQPYAKLGAYKIDSNKKYIDLFFYEGKWINPEKIKSKKISLQNKNNGIHLKHTK